jgi:metal-responsive CopG/Arc/MetJ family transcriptional regulator
MPSILIQLDEATYQALDRIVASAKTKRTQFIRDAVKAAIRQHESRQMREAYRKYPDSAREADNWARCEKFKA